MLISELSKRVRKSLSKTKWKFPREVERFVQEKGYKKFGAGKFSSVYGKGRGDHVIKISRREDKCWLLFAKWVKSQRRTKHLPKITDITEFKKGDETYFICVMEKLQPIKVSEIDWEKQDLPMLAWLWLRYSIFPYAFARAYQKHTGTMKYYQDLPNPQKSEMKKLAQAYQDRNPPFVQTLTALKQYFRGKCEMDIHEGNIMIRPATGDLIFIDPAAYYIPDYR